MNNNSYYPKESAGRLMIKNVPTVVLDSTIGEVEKILIKQAKDFDSINYIYILDTHGILKGVMSVREVFSNEKEVLVKKVMTKQLITARSHTDQERVAKLSIKYNLKSIPVVDNKGHFLGSVPSDVILNILHEENIEDALYSAGIARSDNPSQMLLKGSKISYFKQRFPWLIFGMMGGLLAAVIIGFFEEMLEEMIVLAAFLPAVVYMADAVGSQTQTVFIRSLTMDSLFNRTLYYRKETVVSLALALVLGILAWIFVSWWWQSSSLGIILGISFFLTIIFATLVAVVLPLVFNKLKLDPAVASGPFATVIRDIASILIYLLVITILLPVLG